MVELVWAPPELWTIPVRGSGSTSNQTMKKPTIRPTKTWSATTRPSVAEPDEELVESGSANAVPGVGATAVPIPSAIAKC